MPPDTSNGMSRLSDSAIIPEDVPAPFFAKHFKPYEFIANLVKDKSVLEIGCGDGYGAAYLSGYAREVTAVDYSRENIEHAMSRYKKPNLTFKLMEATALDFSDSSFDAVCSFQVIEHIPEDKLSWYLSEISRVLKNNGVVYLTTLNLKHVMKSPLTYKKNPDHFREFDLTGLRDLLCRQFKGIKIYGLSPTFKHCFFLRLKRTGIFNIFPQRINPVSRFYAGITTGDFIITDKNLKKASDFLCVCVKTEDFLIRNDI